MDSFFVDFDSFSRPLRDKRQLRRSAKKQHVRKSAEVYVVSSRPNSRTASKSLGPSIGDSGKPRGRLKLPRLDGDGDGLTSVLSPTGIDNVPVANVVAKYAALGVELIDRDILEDRINGMSLDEAATKYKKDRADIRKREVRLMAAMRRLGEDLPAEYADRLSRDTTKPSPAELPEVAEAPKDRRGRPLKYDTNKVREVIGSRKPGQSLRSLSRESGIPYQTIIDRIRKDALLAQNQSSEGEQAIVDALRGGMTNAQAQKKFGIGAGQVDSLASKYNIPEALSPRAKRNGIALRALTDPKDERTLPEIASASGISVGTVVRLLQDLTNNDPTQVAHRRPGKKGRKITDSDMAADLRSGISMSDVARKYGVSRQAVLQYARRRNIDVTKARRGPKPGRKPETLDKIERAREYWQNNPNATQSEIAGRFKIPQIVAQSIASELGFSKGQLRDRTKQVTKLFDELVYPGMTMEDRNALADIIAEELNMPRSQVGGIIARISLADSKRSKTGKMLKARAEYDRIVTTNPKINKTKLRERLAEKYDTTPQSLSVFISSERRLSDQEIKIADAYEKLKDSDDFFNLPRLEAYKRLAKQLGTSEGRVQLAISKYSRVFYPKADADKDLKKNKISTTDWAMLRRFISGRYELSDIAEEFKTTESKALKRINLLKSLIRKHNLVIPGTRNAARVEEIPTPRPTPAVRKRTWSSSGVDRKSLDDRRFDSAVSQILNWRRIMR